MRDHDHSIRLTGAWEGYLEWKLICNHDKEDQRYFDPEYPNDCMIEEWHSAMGLELVDGAGHVNVWGEIPLWTVTKDFAEEPVLLGREQYIQHTEVYGPESEPIK